ncbi:MAG TPA: hypothetical protein VET66_10000, partial [Steroidobacteraceae bacterium]|nr:hypothetical protein [Dehalococcoidia bacterium]HYM28472.1 hypothetical protein [Steroidobacteraceae bacterium]
MKRFRSMRVAVVGGIVVAALASTAAIVAAQTPAAGTTSTGTSFLARVAQKLGISTTTLETAVKSSAADEVNARVQAGTLTQAQADQILQRIANAPAGSFGFGPRFGMRGPGGPGGVADPAALAQFLGISADQLRTESQGSGATLTSIAAAHGKSVADLKAFLTAQAKAHLSQDVANGRLTQAQADARLAQMTQDLDQIISRPLPLAHDGLGGPPPLAPSGATTPSGSQTPATVQ